MSKLTITIIDVGWGDSIFLHSVDQTGDSHFGLIDSNDSENLRSSLIYLKRFFEKEFGGTAITKPTFDFVLLSHEHADHAKGLKRIIQNFGTKYFYYPKSLSWSSFAALIRFANASSNVHHHESLDDTKTFPRFGDVDVQILWPRWDEEPSDNPNNNSVVLLLTLGNHSAILCGDAEEEVWHQIAHLIPKNTVFFKVPHHGSRNGTFDPARATPWVDACPVNAELAISSHIVPFQHPHQEVIHLFNNKGMSFKRTDHHHHIEFSTDGHRKDLRYFH